MILSFARTRKRCQRARHVVAQAFGCKANKICHRQHLCLTTPLSHNSRWLVVGALKGDFPRSPLKRFLIGCKKFVEFVFNVNKKISILISALHLGESGVQNFVAKKGLKEHNCYAGI